MGRRTYGTGSIVDRPNGKKQALFSGPDGRRVARTFPTKRLAELWLAKQAAAAADGTLQAPSRLTVGALIDTWFATKPLASRNTRHSYAYYAGLAGPLRHLRADRLTPDVVQRWANALSDPRGLSPNTVRCAVAWLGLCYRDGIGWRLVRANPAEHIVTPRVDTSRRPAWKEAEAKRFLDAVAGDELELFWTLALETGARQGELRHCRWDDLDWARGVLRLEGSLDDKTRQPGETKTRQKRRVRLRPATLKLAAWALEWQRLRFGSPRPWMFVARNGRPFSGNQIRHRLDKLLATLEVGRVTPHGLRHSNARILVRRGVPLKEVQARLGHATLAMTADLYGDVEAEDFEAALGALDAALGPSAADLQQDGPTTNEDG